MGSDDLHHKRKARQARNLARRRSRRESYDRVLIVCEGAKTEKNYLQELRNSLKLNPANIEIVGDRGSSPISVVQHAKRRFTDESRKGDTYDKVYCVFDKATHHSYLQAINNYEQSKPTGVYSAITSVPCFEYWFLLHFEYSTKPYTGTGTRSACDDLIRDLQIHVKNYAKGTNDWFSKLEMRTDQAISNSKRAMSTAKNSNTDNPTTRMHELVEYLRHLDK